MEKLFKIILSVCFLSAVFAILPSVSFAQENGPIATVNIYNVKMVSQASNVFKISFDIFNREKIQPDVKYGIQLWQGQKLIDEKIFDEQLVLGAGETIKKEVEYSAPTYLFGNYELSVFSRNSRNLPLGINRVGVVALSGNGEFVEILGQSCYLAQEGQTERHYLKDGGAVASPGKKLAGVCDVVSHFKSEVSFEPRVSNNAGNNLGGPISIKPGETKTINFVLFEKSPVQSSESKLTLWSQKSQISDAVSFFYTPQGTSGIIMNARLDKDYYFAKEKAQVSISWNLWDARVTSAKTLQELENLKYKGLFEISLKDGQGRDCADVLKSEAETSDPSVTFTMPVKMDCLNPQASVVLKDEAGEFLDSQEFSVNSKNIPAEPPVSGKRTTLIVLAALFVLALAFFAWNNFRKKQKSIPVSLLLLLFPIMAAGIFFFFGQTAKAETWRYPVSGGVVISYFNVNFSKQSYDVGENFAYNGSIYTENNTAVYLLATYRIYADIPYGVSENIVNAFPPNTPPILPNQPSTIAWNIVSPFSNAPVPSCGWPYNNNIVTVNFRYGRWISDKLGGSIQGYLVNEAMNAFINCSDLNVLVDGPGSGTVTGQGISCTTGNTDGCKEHFTYATPIILTPNPAVGSIFSGWSGACAGYPPNSSCQLSMDFFHNPQNAVATFGLAPSVDIKARKAGSGFYSDGPIFIDYNSPAELQWTSNNVSNCSISPGGWTGTSGNNQPTGNLTTSQTYTASCDGGSINDSVTINVGGAPSSCNLAISPISISFVGSGQSNDINASGAVGAISWSSGNSFVASVNPNSGNRTTVTSGVSGSAIITATDSGVAGCSKTADVSVSAPANYTLIVTKAGTGTGSVVSDSPGINCGSACPSQSAVYTPSASVRLSESADIGSSFVGWSGCDSITTTMGGTQYCNLTMNTGKNVIATFSGGEVCAGGVPFWPGGASANATAASCSQINLQWTAASNASGYNIRRLKSVGASWNIDKDFGGFPQIVGGQTTYSDSGGIEPNAQYMYEIYPYNACGNAYQIGTNAANVPFCPISSIPNPAPNASCPSGQTFQDFQSMAGGALSEPVVEKLANGTLIIAVRGGDNLIYIKEYGGPNPKEWYKVDEFSKTGARPKLIWEGGNLWLYVKGYVEGMSDDSIYHIWRGQYIGSQNWGAWQDTGILNPGFGEAGPSSVDVSGTKYKVTGLFPIMLQTCEQANNYSACNSISVNGGASAVEENKQFNAAVSMKNTGAQSWNSVTVNPAKPHRLGDQNSIFSPYTSIWGDNRVDLPSATIAPNGIADFIFSRIAPLTQGVYDFNWMMVQEGEEWFGQICTKRLGVCKKPSNLQPSGSVVGSSVNLSWNQVSEAVSYYVRLEDGVDDQEWDDSRFPGKCNPAAPDKHYYCENDIPASSICSGGTCTITNVPVIVGRNYTYWLHSGYTDERSTYCADSKTFSPVSGNQPPIAVATISSDGTNYYNSISVIQNTPTSIWLAADRPIGAGSDDPNGWTNATNGVSNGGKCEWNSNLDPDSPPVFESAATKNNPSPDASFCNIGPMKPDGTWGAGGTLKFNDDAGTKTYQVLRITDKQGAVSNIDAVSVTVQTVISIKSTGSGNVTAPGINCVNGVGDCSEIYSSPQDVTLTATASGSTFAGWGGDCASAGTNPTCTVNTARTRNVTTTFNPFGACVITSQPQSPPICSGAAANLSVTTSASNHQWYLGSSGVTTNPVGTNSSSYNTGALSATTNYWVRVSGVSCTSANSNTATVTVNPSTSITSSPSNRTIDYNQPTTLTVIASGTGLSYQWYEGTSGNGTAIPGATNSSYITPALTATTNYWVKVSGACGAAQDSDTATVTVSPPATRNLTVNKIGSGGRVTSDIGGVDCGLGCTSQGPIGFSQGDDVELTVSLSLGWRFVRWRDNASSCGTNRVCVIDMNTDKTATAEFESTDSDWKEINPWQ